MDVGEELGHSHRMETRPKPGDDLRHGAPAASPAVSIHRVRPGEYVTTPASAPWWERDEDLHRARLRSACHHINGAVAVLQSAALLHGAHLKTLSPQAHLWVPWRRSATPGQTGRLWSLSPALREVRLSGRSVVNHRMEIDQEDVVDIDGMPTTGLMQTVVQCARFLPADEAFDVVDSLVAVAAGRDAQWREHRSEVESAARMFLESARRVLEGFRGQRGAAQAREILECSTPLSESVWESEMRRVALAAGYVEAEPQMEIRTSTGVRWADLGMRRARRCFEANGDVKYSGPDGDDVREAQAWRNEELRSAGFRVVDLAVPQIRDTAGLLRVLNEHAGDTRGRRGRRLLWTPFERARFA